MDAELVRLLPTGLVAIFAGLFLFAMEAPELPKGEPMLAAIAGLVAGIGIIAVSTWRFFRRGGRCSCCRRWAFTRALRSRP